MTDIKPTDQNRRQMLRASLALGVGTSAAVITGPRTAHAARKNNLIINASELGLRPSSRSDQTQTFQYAINKAAERNMALHLAPGSYLAGKLTLRPGSQIIGAPHKTRLVYNGNRAFITATKADEILLNGLVIDGNSKILDPAQAADALISLNNCAHLNIKNIQLTESLVNGISLRACSGNLTDLAINSCTDTGLFCLDSSNLIISHSEIKNCGNNGIQIWQSKPREDGTIISNCHIHNIKAKAGGDGQNGNAINIYRAGSVTVTSNRISDCAFSAIRGNAASNLIMATNNCARLGEVALYAEFGFEGAVITSNIIDHAATGISVTNFNDGGRLAIVQGNLIRNMKRREQSQDKRGIGISVEADTLVSGNIVENAETIGLLIGWGKYMRDVSATGNIIRNAAIGIGISAEKSNNLIHVSGNLITGAKKGAIRAMLYDEPTGPDLVTSSAETYPNFALLGNIAS